MKKLFGLNISDDAICGIGSVILCDYKVIREAPEALLERCRHCGRRQVYRRHRKTGRMDNLKYASDHLRNFLQPYGQMTKLYIKIYGYEHYLKNKTREEEKTEDIQAGARDMYKTLGRKSVNFG